MAQSLKCQNCNSEEIRKASRIFLGISLIALAAALLLPRIINGHFILIAPSAIMGYIFLFLGLSVITPKFFCKACGKKIRKP
jgi:hypothetical protein